MDLINLNRQLYQTRKLSTPMKMRKLFLLGLPLTASTRYPSRLLAWTRLVWGLILAGPWLAGAAVPTESLTLWLQGDAGITFNGDAVSAWADQSGQGHDATQTSVASQPARVITGTGRPALRFDGANDFLSFAAPINGFDGLTIFLVANNLSAAQNGGSSYADCPAIFWDETASWGWVFLSPFQNNVNWRIGTTTTANNHSYPRPASIGQAYSLTTLVKNADVESLYIDRSLALQIDFKNYPLAGVADNGYLGQGAGKYFHGEILEVLVYTRGLSDTEREAVEAYLHEKYFANQRPTIEITSPAAGAALSAPATLEVTANTQDDGSVSQVEFYANGIWIGTDDSAPFTATWSNVAGGAYGLTAKATDNAGAWAMSERVVVYVNYATPEEGPVLNGLGLWFKADAGITAVDGKVSAWADQSGQERHAVQPLTVAQPALVTSGLGTPAVSFDGLASHLTFGMPMNGLSELTLVLVANNTVPQTTGAAGEGSAAIFWTESDGWGALSLGVFQDSVTWRIGTTVPQTGSPNYPGPAYTRPASVSRDYSRVVVRKDQTEESLYLGGELVKTVSGKAATTAGIDENGGNLGRGVLSAVWTYFRGEILEALVFTRALSEAELADMDAYLRAKYWSRTPPTITLTSPANSTAITSPADIIVTANAADADGTIAKVEFYDGGRLIGTATSSPYTFTLAQASQGAHQLSAKATDNDGLSSYSLPVFVFAHAASGFTRLDNFENRSIGSILYQGDWLGEFGSDRVVMDPTSFAGGNTNNRVLRLATANQSLSLPALIPEGQTGTLFFRAASTTWNRDDVSIGFSDQPCYGYAAASDYEVQGVRRTGNDLGNKNIGVYDGTTAYTECHPFLSDVWYKIWVVVDNTADTWQMFIQDDTVAEPTAVSHDGIETFSFRNGTDVNPLIRFFLWTPQQSVWNGEGGGFWLDDIYLAEGRNLSDPTTVTPPPPTLAIVRNGNELAISWPAASAGFVLESALSLTSPEWSSVPNPPVPAGDTITVTVTIDGAAKYYRLRK